LNFTGGQGHFLAEMDRVVKYRKKRWNTNGFQLGHFFAEMDSAEDAKRVPAAIRVSIGPLLRRNG